MSDQPEGATPASAATSRVEYAVQFDVTFPGKLTSTALMRVPWPDTASRDAASREITRLTGCADDIKRENFRVLRREIGPWTEVSEQAAQ